MALKRALLLTLAGGLGLGGAIGACAKGASSVDEGDTTTPTTTTTTTTTGGMGGTGGEMPAGMGGTPAGMGGMGGVGGEEPPCSESPCKVIAPQCGCEDPNTKCSLQSYMRTCKAKGSGQAGEACDNDADCDAGTMCLFIGGLGVCREFCDMDASCAPPGGLCQIELSLSPGTEKWCSDNCDPISGTGCTIAGSKCELLQAADPPQPWFSVCVDAGTGVAGAPCDSLDDCGVGLGCLTVSSVSTCHPWCNVDAPSCPVATPTCAPFNPVLMVGSIEYGGCL
jgi:hypothetical protein